jgi:hypothetical protein
MRTNEWAVLHRLADGLGRTDKLDFVQHMAATTEVSLHRLGHRLLDPQLIRTPLLMEARTR